MVADLTTYVVVMQAERFLSRAPAITNEKRRSVDRFKVGDYSPLRDKAGVNLLSYAAASSAKEDVLCRSA